MLPVRATVTLAAIVWAMLVLAAPLLAGTSSGDDLRLRVATVVYVTGSLICHQRPERSFHVHGRALPVCARCTGLYAGAALGVLVPLLPRRFTRARSRPPAWWRRALVAALVPMALSVAIEWLTPLRVSNAARAATGVIAGAAVAAFVIARPELGVARAERGARRPEVN